MYAFARLLAITFVDMAEEMDARPHSEDSNEQINAARLFSF